MEARDAVRREPGVAEEVGDLRAQDRPVGDGAREGGAVGVALGGRDRVQPRVETADAHRDLAFAEVGQRGDAPPHLRHGVGSGGPGGIIALDERAARVEVIPLDCLADQPRDLVGGRWLFPIRLHVAPSLSRIWSSVGCSR